MYNTQILYKAKNSAVKFFDDYSSMVFEAKYEAIRGTGLKILTPKQIFQRLLIVLAQVKARNNSKYLLNEIR